MKTPFGVWNRASVPRSSSMMSGRFSSPSAPASRTISAGRADGQLKRQRVVDGVADPDVGVDPLERDVRPAGRLQDRADRLGVGHRERTGAAARRLVRRRRQMFARDLLGHPEVGVVLDAPVDDHQEAPARAGRAAQVGHRRRRVGEEHRPEPREADVERPLELHGLSVGELERGARDAGARGVGAADLQERLAAVDPQRASGRAGELDGRLAEPAPHVQHPLARVDGVHLQRALAVDGDSVGQHPPEAGELRHQDLVPEPDRLRVRRACFRHVSRIPADTYIAHKETQRITIR